MQWNTRERLNIIIGLVCIKGYTGFKYKGSDNRGIRGEQIQSSGGSGGSEEMGGALSSGG